MLRMTVVVKIFIPITHYALLIKNSMIFPLGGHNYTCNDVIGVGIQDRVNDAMYMAYRTALRADPLLKDELLERAKASGNVTNSALESAAYSLWLSSFEAQGAVKRAIVCTLMKGAQGVPPVSDAFDEASGEEVGAIVDFFTQALRARNAKRQPSGQNSADETEPDSTPSGSAPQTSVPLYPSDTTTVSNGGLSPDAIHNASAT